MRAKREREQCQAEQLLAAAMENDINLLREMKSVKKGKSGGTCELPDTVGNANGEQNIAEMFKTTYESLYNSAPTTTEMSSLKSVLEELINVADVMEEN